METSVKESNECRERRFRFHANVESTDIMCVNVDSFDDKQQGNPYKSFRDPGVSSVVISVDLEETANIQGVTLDLNHCSSEDHALIDIEVNEVTHIMRYSEEGVDTFGHDYFNIPVHMLKEGRNNVIIRLNEESPGGYLLSDVEFVLKYTSPEVENGQDVSDVENTPSSADTENTPLSADVEHIHSFSDGENTSSSSEEEVLMKKCYKFDPNDELSNMQYTYTETTDFYRKGAPYKILHSPGQSSAAMVIQIEDNWEPQELTMTLNHCRTSGHGIVDLIVNDNPYMFGYKEARWDNFERSSFLIPVHFLKEGLNEFVIRLNGNSPGVYWLSDAEFTLKYMVEDDTSQ